MSKAEFDKMFVAYNTNSKNHDDLSTPGFVTPPPADIIGNNHFKKPRSQTVDRAPEPFKLKKDMLSSIYDNETFKSARNSIVNFGNALVGAAVKQNPNKDSLRTSSPVLK